MLDRLVSTHPKHYRLIWAKFKGRRRKNVL